MAWPSVRTVFTVTPFRIRKGSPKYSGTLVASRRVAMPFGRLVETSQIVSIEIQLHVEIGEA
jgi:hypothetical protein